MAKLREKSAVKEMARLPVMICGCVEAVHLGVKENLPKLYGTAD
jgi:hypothetical protein